MPEDVKTLLMVLGPLVGLFGVLLAFILNTTWSTLRSNIERREGDAAYKAEVRAHMAFMEDHAAATKKALEELHELRAQFKAFVENAGDRLARIERRVDATGD